MIRSYPPGARLYVNDKLIGIAPIEYQMPHSEIGDERRVRLERDGYEQLNGKLRTQICGGRIAGGIFTLGLVLLIRGPTCLVSPQDFSLQPVLRRAGDSAQGGSSSPSVEDRLERLERMRERGQVNQQEFEQYRREILKGL